MNDCRPLEVVGRGSETQLQVGENYSYLLNLRPNICDTNFTSKKQRFNLITKLIKTAIVEISDEWVIIFSAQRFFILKVSITSGKFISLTIVTRHAPNFQK